MVVDLMYNILFYIKNSVSGVDDKHAYSVKTFEEVLQFIYDYKDHITQNASIEIIKSVNMTHDTLNNEVL